MSAPGEIFFSFTGVSFTSAFHPELPSSRVNPQNRVERLNASRFNVPFANGAGFPEIEVSCSARYSAMQRAERANPISGAKLAVAVGANKEAVLDVYNIEKMCTSVSSLSDELISQRVDPWTSFSVGEVANVAYELERSKKRGGPTPESVLCSLGIEFEPRSKLIEFGRELKSLLKDVSSNSESGPTLRAEEVATVMTFLKTVTGMFTKKAKEQLKLKLTRGLAKANRPGKKQSQPGKKRAPLPVAPIPKN